MKYNPYTPLIVIFGYLSGLVTGVLMMFVNDRGFNVESLFVLVFTILLYAFFFFLILKHDKEEKKK